MPTLLLIRHGENDYVKKNKMAGRLPGVHLNQKGLEQAQALAEKYAAAPLKAVYSSPLERALETARPLAQALNLEVIPRPGLIETDIGDWQGQSLKKLSRLKVWQLVQRAPSRFRFPGGESFAESQYRICQELETLCALHAPQDWFACVCHADPIKLAVAFYLGMPLDHFQRLVISTGSATILHLDETGARLIALNDNPMFRFPKN